MQNIFINLLEKWIFIVWVFFSISTADILNSISQCNIAVFWRGQLWHTLWPCRPSLCLFFFSLFLFIFIIFYFLFSCIIKIIYLNALLDCFIVIHVVVLALWFFPLLLLIIFCCVTVYGVSFFLIAPFLFLYFVAAAHYKSMISYLLVTFFSVSRYEQSLLRNGFIDDYCFTFMFKI